MKGYRAARLIITNHVNFITVIILIISSSLGGYCGTGLYLCTCFARASLTLLAVPTTVDECMFNGVVLVYAVTSGSHPTSKGQLCLSQML